MAKGQRHGNREAKKPKQPKAPAKVEPLLGSQYKTAIGKSQPAGKSKG